MRINRLYTTSNRSPYADIAFHNVKSEIRNPDNSIVFSLDEVEVPTAWSQVAAEIGSLRNRPHPEEIIRRGASAQRFDEFRCRRFQLHRDWRVNLV